MPTIEPHNKRIFVTVENALPGLEEQTPLILLPEDFRSSKEVLREHTTAQVQSLAVDCTTSIEVGAKVVFPTHLMETVEIRGDQYHFIPENQVIASWVE
jgi:co-chaperonin GroES (HSP10)